jgi:superfamily II DNA/RNA helicase
MFAEQHEEFEIDVDTSTYRLATRLSRFHNLPELTTMLASFADFHSVDQSDGLPEFSGYTDGIVRKSPEFAEFLEDISERAEDVRNGRVSRKKDNMLLITTDGRKAALDMRLIDAKVPVMDSKALQAAENVADIYWKTMDRRSTQLVFCDTSTPKDTFNLYDEMKRLLIRFGIPESEIAFIHSAGTEAKRKRLFKAVRDGDVRVLIGSTFKLGLGVNVQDRLIAVHHLDVPWRPADMTQREGRILRQGNENQKVCIFRYITEGSFDAYSWQLLETKQRFISDLLSGSISERSAEDIENTVLSYAEVKALAIGNPLMKERVETANELSRSLALQRKLTETCVALRQALADLPGEMQKMDRWIDCCRKDEAEFKAWEQAHPFPESNQEKEALQEERRNLRKILGDAVRDNVLATSEKVLMDYKGFRIILPAAMDPAKPYVWLEGNGRYRVELGGTDIGILIRIDNVMTDFPDRLSRLERRRLELSEREKEIRKELAKNDGYQEKIEELKRKLAALDEKLGVG